MTYLVDTCGWIEWIADGILADTFASYFQQPEELVVPTVLQYELYRWVCREKDDATALDIIAFTEQCHVITLDTALALQAADLAKQHGLAAMDALIYSTARQTGTTLVTSDKHFENLPDVQYFPKSAS